MGLANSILESINTALRIYNTGLKDAVVGNHPQPSGRDAMGAKIYSLGYEAGVAIRTNFVRGQDD